MISANTLGLWLRAAPRERTNAMIDLLAAGDLVAIADGDGFGVARSHDDQITRYEIGKPVMAAAVA